MTDTGEDAELRPPSRAGNHARRHWVVLAIACAVWLLAFLLHELPGGRVAVRGIPQFPLPQACGSRVLFGFALPRLRLDSVDDPYRGRRLAALPGANIASPD